MENSIKICMSVEDADYVQREFDRSDNPHFTILKRFVLPIDDVVQLELIAESTMDIWFLAKSVQMWQEHDERLKKISEDYCAKIKSSEL